MFYIRNLPLQTFYFEPLINLMHKLGISWDCNRSGTYFSSLSASINSIKIHCKPLVHISCSLSDVSISFLMVPGLLLPDYLYFHLFVLHLSCVKKKNIAQILALGKYLQCLLTGKEINPICKGMWFSCQCLVVCITLTQKGDVPTVVSSVFSQ